MTKKVAIIVGSLRKKSYTRAIAEQAASLLPEGYQAVDIDISDLDLYNQDLDDENRIPESWQRFRQQMSSIDAVIFATPEHNRSMTAALKNALDVGSRPFGHTAWDRKAALVISVSIGGLSAFGANHQLRQSLVFLNMPVVAQPEVYIGNVKQILNDNLQVTDEGTIGFLQTAVDAFVDLAKRFD